MNDAAAIALFGLFMGFVMRGVPNPELGAALAQFRVRALPVGGHFGRRPRHGGHDEPPAGAVGREVIHAAMSAERHATARAPMRTGRGN